MQFSKRVLAVALLVSTSGCASDRATNPVERVAGESVTPLLASSTIMAELDLTVGRTVRINPRTTGRTSRLRWSTSNQAVASVSSAGVVTAHSLGTTIVTVSGTGVLEQYRVVVAAPSVIGISLAPSSGVTLNVGQSQQFSTTTTWSDGLARSASVTYTATGGTISNTGLFTAGNLAGTFMVIAACSCGSTAIADTTPVTVNAVAPQLTRLSVNPKTVTLDPGGSQQFGVTASWSTGATSVPPVTWSVTGGVITATGAYVAPSAPGTYRVIVAHSGGTARDTATVTVPGETLRPPPSSFTQHLPAGLTLVTDTWFGNLRAQGVMNEDSLVHYWSSRNATDNSAPFGSGVYETFYPGNDAGNGAGGGLLLGPSGRQWRQVYFAMMLWVPANYSTHSNGEKFFYPLIKTPGQADQSVFVEWRPLENLDTPNGSTFGFHMITYATGVGGKRWLPGLATPARVTKGRWVRVEVFMVMNTVGRSDGVWRAWVDGQPAADLSNVQYSTATVASFFDGIRFTGTRGGGASTVLTPPEGQVRRYDRLAFFASN